MSHALAEVDDIPVTLVIAIAYGTLAVVTGMLPEAEDFHVRLAHFGMLIPAAAAAGEPWRLVAHAFLHGNILHLLVNLASFIAIGPALERSLGSVRFAALYLVSALGGGLAVCLWTPMTPVVGGSGALFGMTGALVAVNMRSGRHLFAFLDFEGPRRVLGLIVVNLLIGLLIPIISNTAHVGGLITGFVVTFLWLRPGTQSPALRHWRIATAALFASVLLWSLFPVTRFDWLLLRAAATADPERSADLQRAGQLALTLTVEPESPEELDPPRPR